MIAAPVQAEKLKIRTTGRDKFLLKQNKATKKKRILGRIPQIAPLVKSCIITGSPLFSRYSQTSTRAPVRGMTPIKPAAEGIRLPIAVAKRIIATLKTTLIKSCIFSSKILERLAKTFNVFKH